MRSGLLVLVGLFGCASAPPAGWAPGELVIEQLDLADGVIGAATLVVGPDGTTVLIDVGNDRHAGAVLEAVARHADGDAARARSVDWVVLTHLHADHVGGFDALVEPGRRNDDDPLEVVEGVIWRGPFDARAPGANGAESEAVCTYLAERPALDRRLCDGPADAPCGLAGDGAPWPATDCDGLLADGPPARIALGDGATLTLFAVDGWALAGDGLVFADALDGEYGDAAENGRSLVGVIRYGEFTYVVAGDLTGGGKGTPDVEAVVVAGAHAAADAGVPHPVPADGADVIQLAHHGIDSSTQDAWLAWLLPDDGAERHAIVGASGSYLAAPAQAVLDRVAPRLGGGSVWVTRRGSAAGRHDVLRVAGGPVLVRVAAGGGSYAVEAGG